MQNKIKKILLPLFMLGTLVGCGSNETPIDNGDKEETKIDVDLTTLSSTMVYSEVYHMLSKPEDYIGKTIKMNGIFVAYTNKDQTIYYPAVIVQDATACCANGLEFLLKNNASYPSDYPKLNTEITVVGTFETYLEDGQTYTHLIDCDLL